MKYVIKANGYFWNGKDFLNNVSFAKVYSNKGLAVMAMKRLKKGAFKELHKRIRYTVDVVGV